MIELPDFEKAFDYENNFYLSCDASRLKKILAHYEIYKNTLDVPGDVFEFGILKGCSFTRFAAFRQFYKQEDKKLIGFDSFGEFPETEFEPDVKERLRHIELCGDESIDKDQLKDVLSRKGTGENIELIEGDITQTLPKYVEDNPDLKVSLINLDVDIYEPSKVILECLYPRLSKGGVLILDDYGQWEGETKAVDEYFEGQNVKIQSLPMFDKPLFIVKE